jgi:hypothetical protein
MAPHPTKKRPQWQTLPLLKIFQDQKSSSMPDFLIRISVTNNCSSSGWAMLLCVNNAAKNSALADVLENCISAANANTNIPPTDGTIMDSFKSSFTQQAVEKATISLTNYCILTNLSAKL